MFKNIYCMLTIGCHLSIASGYEAMGEVALKINANTFQFFTRNPQGGRAAKINIEDADKLKEIIEKNNFGPILAHAPYTYNLCSSKPEVREFAHRMMIDDLARLDMLPCHLLNFHPGSHTSQGVEIGIEQIVTALNEIIDPGQKTIMLLETMSGKGSEIGRSFEELARIIEGVNVKEKIGVCLDTCHIFEAGYDIVNDLNSVVERFEEVIGLDKLYAIHLNDSKNPLGAAKDRHEQIGKGTIGLDAIVSVINHPKLKNFPFYLETPNEVDGYAEEIALLRSLYKG